MSGFPDYDLHGRTAMTAKRRFRVIEALADHSQCTHDKH
jgi:hypothetical protein